MDSEPLHYRAFQEVLAPLGMGHDYEHYLKHYIGFDDRDAFLEAFRCAGRPLAPGALAALIQAKEAALQRILADGISTFPGVVALVQQLAEHGVPLAVASGALRHEVEGFLDALGIRKAFSAIVAADDVNRSKPDPETYLTALKRLSEVLPSRELRPDACIAIEDTQAGIRSAKSAGLFVIAVANSYGADQLSEADFVVESLVEIDVVRMVQLLER